MFFVCICVFFAGIDLAFIENGYIYHTKYDTADRILTDSIQRAGMQKHTCVFLCALNLNDVIFYLITCLSSAFISHSLQIDSAHGSLWVCLSVSQGESGHCSSGVVKPAASIVFLFHRHKQMLSICALSPSLTGQHSANFIVSPRTEERIHTQRPRTFTVALALIYFVRPCC